MENMDYSTHIVLIYTITSIFFILNIYLSFKIKIEYNKYQKRSLSTSILSLFYHESYIALALYSILFRIWPIIKGNYCLDCHIVSFILGLALIIVGLIIYIECMKCIKSALRAIGFKSDILITDGIYNKSRNPQSLGRAIGLIGIGLMSRSYFTLFLALFWIFLNHYNILVEENFLVKKFGELYLDYCELTPRYCTIRNRKKINTDEDK